MGFTACQKISTADVLSGLFACVNSAFSTTFIIALNALFTDWLASFQANRASTASVQAVCLGVTLGGGVSSFYPVHHHFIIYYYYLWVLPSSCRPVLLSCLRLPAVLSPSSCCPVLLPCLHPVAVWSPSPCCPVSVFLLSCLAVLSPSCSCPVSVLSLSCLRLVARFPSCLCLVAVWLLSCLHLDMDWNLFPIKLPFKPCTATRQLPCAWSFRSQQYHVKPQTHA